MKNGTLSKGPVFCMIERPQASGCIIKNEGADAPSLFMISE